jgi:hypothetical protein
MTPQQKQAYVIADNKLALNAGWDEQVLGEELKEILAGDESFDVSLTGFSIAEVDSLIRGLLTRTPVTLRTTFCRRSRDRPRSVARVTSGPSVHIDSSAEAHSTPMSSQP